MSDPKQANQPLAMVAKVIDPRTAVINKGLRDGVENGQRFLVYAIEEDELIDPETGASLGHLEVVRGTAKVIHCQERMATIESDRKETLDRKVVREVPRPIIGLLGISMSSTGPSMETISNPTTETIPFDEIEVGDLAKKL